MRFTELRRKRSQAGVVFATVDIMLIVPVVLTSFLCLLDAGLMSCYKEKMSFILNEAGQYAVNLPPTENVNLRTQALVKDLVAKTGLKFANLRVDVKNIKVSQEDAISITATGSCPLLEGSCLPVAVSLSDTAVALVPLNRVFATVAINPYPYSAQSPHDNSSVYLPVIRPSHDLPVWTFPYDPSINGLQVVQGNAPVPPDPRNANANFASRPSLY